MRLRDYQVRALDAATADFREVVSTLIVSATGTGKTIMFGHLAQRFAVDGKRVLVIAHREELIFQARDKIAAVTDEMPEVEMGEHTIDADGPNLYDGRRHRSRFVVASVQTLNAGMRGAGRMVKLDPFTFSLVVIDEAHHSPARSYRKVIDHFKVNPDLRILGVTATPDRSDEEALGQIFERCSFKYEISNGIEDGWLAPVVERTITVKSLDFSACRSMAGDFNSADIAAAMEYEPNLHGIADPTLEMAAGRKTIVFAASVAHAERLCEIFNRHHRDSARFVSGKTDEVTRKHILSDHKSGAFQILVNCMVLTEGYDDPTVEVIVVGRPTKSRSLFAQMIGRGTRPLPGTVDHLPTAIERRTAIAGSAKPQVIVLDFTGKAGRHKLTTAADVLGGNYTLAEREEAERIAKTASDTGEPVQMMLALDQARESLTAKAAEEKAKRENAEREAQRRRQHLIGRAQYSVTDVDPFDVLDLAPPVHNGWNKSRPASDKQIELLRRFGINNASDLSANEARVMLDKIFERKKKGQCTFNQAKVLKKYGYPTDVSFEDARATIDVIKANGWQKPTGSQGQLAPPQTYQKQTFHRPAAAVVSSTPTEGVI